MSSSSDQNALKQINKSLEEMKQLLLKAKFEEEESKYTVPTCVRIFNEMKSSSSASDQDDALKQINKSQEEIKQLLLKAKQSEEEENKYSIPTCMRILTEMMKITSYAHWLRLERLEPEEYVDLMKSFEKKEWREIFFNMSNEQRKVWIDSVKNYHRKKKYT